MQGSSSPHIERDCGYADWEGQLILFMNLCMYAGVHNQIIRGVARQSYECMICMYKWVRLMAVPYHIEFPTQIKLRIFICR